MFDEAPEPYRDERSWRLVDPRPSLDANPYTFFVPSRAELSALKPGDEILMIFEDLRDDRRMSEHLWVRYQGRDAWSWCGSIEEQPALVQSLAMGDDVRFMSHHIVGVRNAKVDEDAPERLFFARAFVDPRVLHCGVPIGEMVRKKYWMPFRKRSRYGETGWRIYGDGCGRMPVRRMAHVAIGLVLNLDDSMLPLLNRPFGTVLKRDGDVYLQV